ncbi:unnamed protein product [Schistosoma margrebowiei]|uniref:Condensin complex subunit 2 n=1 Tax=Schistosoma margrebowiei TaxID=48269 RepID=A0A183LXR6_9TREM|nr:unnamed protein product [Schistosoma margrebowiei]VDO82260.1 unnamed protein product [Schistosoma margrebowiei]
MNATLHQDKWDQRDFGDAPLCVFKTSGSKRKHLYFEDERDVCKKPRLSAKGQGCVSTVSSKIANREHTDTNGYQKHLGNKLPLKKEYELMNDPTQNHVITIHETYQLGFLNIMEDNSERKLYTFDFVDSLEVTYPVSITSSDALPIDLPPLFMEPEYSDQLTALANDALNQLTQRINNWLVACQESDDKLILWRHMSAHRASAELRYQTLRLLNILEPHFQHTKFDPQSPNVDKLFSYILKNLELGHSAESSEESDFPKNNPVVSLCPDPEHCLSNLRHLVLSLLQKLLPQLVLPKDFNSKDDLVPLIDSACVYNLDV